jgi:hypothetical protein
MRSDWFGRVENWKGFGGGNEVVESEMKILNGKGGIGVRVYEVAETPF